MRSKRDKKDVPGREGLFRTAGLLIILLLFAFVTPSNAFSASLANVTIKIIPEYLDFQSEVSEKNGIVNAKVVIDARLNDDFQNEKNPFKLFIPENARLGSVIQIDSEGKYQKPEYTIKKGKRARSLTFKSAGRRLIVDYFIDPLKKNDHLRLDYSFRSPYNTDRLNIELLKPIFAESFKITEETSLPFQKTSGKTEEIVYPVFQFQKVAGNKKIDFSIEYSVDRNMREKRADLYARSLPAFVYGSAVSHKGYQAALKMQNTLSMIPCYCGCGAFAHTSLKDCFLRYDGTINDHAAGCDICNKEAIDVDNLNKQGFSLKEFRLYIDKKYSAYGRKTPTPPIL